MSTVSTKSSLSPARRRLVELMQRIGFGRIEGLSVKRGEPVLEPLPRIVREVKFGAQNGARPETALADFALKAPVVELFRHLDSASDAVVERLEVQHGLPFRMMIDDLAA